MISDGMVMMTENDEEQTKKMTTVNSERFLLRAKQKWRKLHWKKKWTKKKKEKMKNCFAVFLLSCESEWWGNQWTNDHDKDGMDEWMDGWENEYLVDSCFLRKINKKKSSAEMEMSVSGRNMSECFFFSVFSDGIKKENRKWKEEKLSENNRGIPILSMHCFDDSFFFSFHSFLHSLSESFHPSIHSVDAFIHPMKHPLTKEWMDERKNGWMD